MFVLLKGKNVQPDSPKETMEGEVRDEDVEQVEQNEGQEGPFTEVDLKQIEEQSVGENHDSNKPSME